MKKNKEITDMDSTDEIRDDPTDEFPVLDIDAMTHDEEHAHPGETEEQDESGTVSSLNRLETDLHSLQSRWSAIESDFRKRETETQDLKSQLSVRDSALKSMDNELKRAQQRHEDLQSELEEAARSHEELKTQVADREEAVRQREADIQAKQVEIDNIVCERDDAAKHAEDLSSQLADQRSQTADATAVTEELESASNALRIRIQDLEAYVDRRKAEWQSMQEELSNYRDTLLGMERIAEDKDILLRSIEKENVALSETLLDLEQQCAELDGRRAEREASNNELQEKLLAAGQDVERLNRELQSLGADHDKHIAAMDDQHTSQLEKSGAEHRSAMAILTKESESQERRIEQLTGDFNEEKKRAEAALADVKRTEDQLCETRDRIGELTSDLAAQKAETEASQDRFGEQEQKALELWEELTATRDRLENANLQLHDRDTLIGEFETRERDQAIQLDSAQRELAARDENILELETELRAQKKTVSLLDRNVERLSELGSSVKALDDQISREVDDGDDHKHDPLRAHHEGPPFIISVEGEHAIKYPLYKKSMTIGRSSNADIQLGWKFISREHAKIVINESAAMIEDLGSKNGIYVNDRPVKRHELHDGDRLELGELQFRFVSALH